MIRQSAPRLYDSEDMNADADKSVVDAVSVVVSAYKSLS